MRTLLLCGMLLIAPGVLVAQDKMVRVPKLDNAKVTVTEVIYQPGVPRERSTRATDQMIVFLDDCRYDRVDSETGKKSAQQRKAGDTIWHNKGDDAPVLINTGEKPYRTLVIELKQ